MFGLKQDWSLDVLPRYFTLEDYDPHPHIKAEVSV